MSDAAGLPDNVVRLISGGKEGKLTTPGGEQVPVRVFERGAGETLACGTGACAAVVASHLNGKTGRHVLVHLPGGDLDIDWSAEDNRVYMTGAAAEVYEGEIL